MSQLETIVSHRSLNDHRRSLEIQLHRLDSIIVADALSEGFNTSEGTNEVNQKTETFHKKSGFRGLLERCFHRKKQSYTFHESG